MYDIGMAVAYLAKWFVRLCIASVVICAIALAQILSVVFYN